MILITNIVYTIGIDKSFPMASPTTENNLTRLTDLILKFTDILFNQKVSLTNVQLDNVLANLFSLPAHTQLANYSTNLSRIVSHTLKKNIENSNVSLRLWIHVAQLTTDYKKVQHELNKELLYLLLMWPLNNLIDESVSVFLSFLLTILSYNFCVWFSGYSV